MWLQHTLDRVGKTPKVLRRASCAARREARCENSLPWYSALCCVSPAAPRCLAALAAYRRRIGLPGTGARLAVHLGHGGGAVQDDDVVAGHLLGGLAEELLLDDEAGRPAERGAAEPRQRHLPVGYPLFFLLPARAVLEDHRALVLDGARDHFLVRREAPHLLALVLGVRGGAAPERRRLFVLLLPLRLLIARGEKALPLALRAVPLEARGVPHAGLRPDVQGALPLAAPAACHLALDRALPAAARAVEVLVHAVLPAGPAPEVEVAGALAARAVLPAVPLVAVLLLVLEALRLLVGVAHDGQVPLHVVLDLEAEGRLLAVVADDVPLAVETL
mmetsp:Transcript_100731/g.285514  ORF Transcript_100731/g.285514 Transcript_100731/m.285514 type:complete len:333 (+) Transcript_100731:227-1225(+)